MARSKKNKTRAETATTHPLKRAALKGMMKDKSKDAQLTVPPATAPVIENVIAHCGVGGFHRSHLAYATDMVLRSSKSPWGITGVGLMPWDAKMSKTLKDQDMLYTLVMQDADASSARVVEAIVDYVFVPEDAPAFEALCVDPRLKIISLTVTEKGYYQTPNGDLDLSAAPVRADVAAWHRGNDRLRAPQTVFGFICCVMQRRRAAKLPPVTVLSCDNLPLNGDLARASTLAFARAVDATLATWIENGATFPNSMVDRITPATEGHHRATLEAEYGVVDAWPVVAERFFQWVVEDKFAAGRPDWERSFASSDEGQSVLFVGDVEPYETMKLRLLNSGHSSLAAVGLLLGHRLVHLSLADRDVLSFLSAYMGQVAATLGPVPGVDLKCYQRQLVDRFANPKIEDTLARLAMDGSQKFGTTLTHALLRMKNTPPATPPSLVVLVLACFLKSTAAGVDEDGGVFEIVDPAGAEIKASAAGAVAGDAAALKAALGAVWGDDVANWAALNGAVAAALARVKADGLRATLAAETAAAEAAPLRRNRSVLTRKDTGLPPKAGDAFARRKSLTSMASDLHLGYFDEAKSAGCRCVVS